MKKFFAVLIWLFGTIALLTSCSSNKAPSCELTLTSTETSVSYSLSFADLGKKQTSYKIEILKGETSVKEEVSSTDVTAGQFSNLDLNTSYKVNVYVTNKTEWDVSLASKDIQTKKGTITGVTFNSQSFVYDGTAKSIEVSNLPAGTEVTYSGNSMTDVGEYTVTATVKKENYEDLVLTAKLTITQASSDFVISDKTVTYTGEAQTIKAITDLEVTYEYYLGETKLESAPVNAGTYTVKAIYAGDKNHAKVEKTATLKIEKAASAITAEDITIKFGEEYDVVATCSVADASLTLEYYQGETKLDEKPTAIGSYSVKVIFDGNDNYKASSKTIALLITNPDNADVTITLDNISTVYGQTYVVAPTADHGVVLEDLVIKYYQLDGTEIEKPVNAGNYEIKITYAGNEDKFLNPASKTVTLTIAKADYDLSGITFADVTYTYDGTEKELVYTGTLPEGVTFVGYTTNKGTDAGTYEAKASFVGADTDNYNVIADLTATLTIEKADPSLEGLQSNFINDYTPGMTIEVFKERLDEKLYFLEDYSLVLQSGENVVKVIYKKGTNYKDVEIDITLKCNAQVIGFTLADGGRQIEGRPFDSANIVVSYQYNDGTSKVVSASFTTSTVNSTAAQFSVDVTITDSNYKLDETTKTVEITPIAAPQVMIYAVYGAGGNTGASYKNDFIILYNASSEDVDLTNWTLQYAGANTATAIGKSNIATLNGVIKGYGFYTVVAAAGNSETNELPFLETADSSNSLALGASNFQLYLSTTSTQIIPASYNQSSYVDMIGAGTSAYSETAAAAAPSATTYVRRKALQDTNDNSVDFEVINFNGTTDFDFLGQGHRAYNYAKAVLDSQNLNFNNLPDSFTLPMSFDGTAITWTTQNADNLSIAADGTVTVNKTTECDGKLIGTIAGYPFGFEFNVFISNKTRLDAPQVSLEHFTLTWTAVTNAASYDIYIDGVLYTNTTALTYDLYDSNFASNFTELKNYAITVVAKCADGSAEYVDSLASSAVALRFADTSDLSALDTSLVYTFAVSVTSKGVWSTYGNANFFVVDSATSQGFLVYRYTNQDIFNSLVYGSKIYISGKFAYSNNMPQLKDFVGLTVTGQVDSTISKITSSVELTAANAGQTIELTGAVVESVTSATNVVVKVGENSFNLYANVSYVSDLTSFGTLLPGNTLNFTGAVGIYNDNIQVYVTSYEITGTNVSDNYKLDSTLAEVNLNASYTCDATITLPTSGTTYSDVSLTYTVSEGVTKTENTLTFASVEEDTPVTVTITATLGTKSKQITINLTIKPKGGNDPEWSNSWSTLESGTYSVLFGTTVSETVRVSKTTFTSSKFDTVEYSTIENTTNYTFTIIVDKDNKTVQIKVGEKYLKYNTSTNFAWADDAYTWDIVTVDGKDYLKAGSADRYILHNGGTTNRFGPYATTNTTNATYSALDFMIL